MITCKECKYWDKDKWMCSCGKFIYGGDIDNSFIFNTNPPYADEELHDMLIYQDFDDFSADFRVGPNFGCIHGIKKEKNLDN